ncbi:hypothetical protein [Streptomyces sp. NPDC054837]
MRAQPCGVEEVDLAAGSGAGDRAVEEPRLGCVLPAVDAGAEQARGFVAGGGPDQGGGVDARRADEQAQQLLVGVVPFGLGFGDPVLDLVPGERVGGDAAPGRRAQGGRLDVGVPGGQCGDPGQDAGSPPSGKAGVVELLVLELGAEGHCGARDVADGVGGGPVPKERCPPARVGPAAGVRRGQGAGGGVQGGDGVAVLEVGRAGSAGAPVGDGVDGLDEVRVMLCGAAYGGPGATAVVQGPRQAAEPGRVRPADDAVLARGVERVPEVDQGLAEGLSVGGVSRTALQRRSWARLLGPSTR